MIAVWGVQTSWNRPPKGLLQRIRAHGISESTTIHSRPKSQASHTAKFDSGLLFTQSRSVSRQVTGKAHDAGSGRGLCCETPSHKSLLQFYGVTGLLRHPDRGGGMFIGYARVSGSE